MPRRKKEVSDRSSDPLRNQHLSGRKMAEEFAAAINNRVMEKEQKVTEKPQQEAAETSANEKPNFPSAEELAIAFAAAINKTVMKETQESEQRKQSVSRLPKKKRIDSGS